ncbi:MAG TPA: hypothetical protein P5509_04230 [Bacteroidales bacterium]|nr:hypothetical protein [Bacteroidales bacterium]
MKFEIEISPNHWVPAIATNKSQTFTIDPNDLTPEEREKIISTFEKCGSGKLMKYEYSRKIHYRAENKIFKRKWDGFTLGTFPIEISEEKITFIYDSLDYKMTYAEEKEVNLRKRNFGQMNRGPKR